MTVWGFLHYKKAKINRRSYFQRIFVKFLWCCWSYLSSVYCHCFFFAFPNKEKGGVLTCDRLLYTQINQLSCLFWQRFTFFEGFSGVIFFCLTTKLQHESSSTLAPVIFATLNYLHYYHETSKQLSLWDLVCYVKDTDLLRGCYPYQWTCDRGLYFFYRVPLGPRYRGPNGPR